MLFNIRFLILFLILFVKPLIALSLQNIISDDETINSYKVYIDTGVAWGRNHEQLEGEEKKYFIKRIFHWMDYFLPNELGNLHANLEKGTLYAKLLLDRKSDLVTHNVITHDELKRHNSICQNFFRDFFEKAAQTTIYQTTRELIIKDAFSLWDKLHFELATTQASSVKSRPFFSTLDEPAPKKNKLNPIGVSVDYPMTDFIVTKIKENSYLSTQKLKNLEKNADLLKIVEDLSGSLLGGEDESLFQNFQTKLDQKNIRTIREEKYTVQNLISTFNTSFIEPLKNKKHIIKNGVNLVPSDSLLEDQKKMIECIIKWKNVFANTYKQSKT